MNFEHRALHLVKEKFPEQVEKIEALFTNDEGFKKLCYDYLVCTRNLKRFIENVDERKAWMQEYSNLKSELENEFYYFLIE